jgi:hypothetical protein
MIWALLAAATTAGAIAFLFSGLRNGKPGGGLFLFALFMTLAIATARFAFGCAKAGLLVTEQKVTVRNPRRTYEIPRSELHRFTAGTQAARLGNPTPGVVLELKSGSVYPVWTLAREGLVWNKANNVSRWTGVAEELNALVHRVH